MTLLKAEKVKSYRHCVGAGRSRCSDDPVLIEYLRCKKAFNKRLHHLAGEYEYELLKYTMVTAELNTVYRVNIAAV